MIRYPQALIDIEAVVADESPTWLTRARKRTALLIKLQRYTETVIDPEGKTQKLAPFWGDVKQIYMRRQYNKCVYCEIGLEGKEYARVQWDLEHFRPKSNVRRWRKHTYSFSTGDDWPVGYYQLAYHLHNYAVSCKTCNSPFKSDYFPGILGPELSGTRQSVMTSFSNVSMHERRPDDERQHAELCGRVPPLPCRLPGGGDEPLPGGGRTAY